MVLEVKNMDFISAQEIANKWGISKRRVQTLCASNRIDNAVRIGNMWVVPSDAVKPEDARHKKNNRDLTNKYVNPIKKARAKIKAIAEKMFTDISDANYSTENAKQVSVYIFASEIMIYKFTRGSKSINREEIEKIVSCTLRCNIDIPDHLRERFSENIHKFISDNPFCLDDALAWFYQYTNKLSDETGISSTQFFTEKYMITTLVDSVDISKINGKILDPACGGGNFLLYCFDVLVDNEVSINDSKLEAQAKIKSVLSKLFGYEIDTLLAAVASINLKTKALLTLHSYGHQIDVSDFKLFTPNIFCSVSNSYIGALDFNKSAHKVRKVGTKLVTTMENIFSNTACIFTNPPFQTIKGMPSNLKQYLKQYYPETKCDMCNAFINLSRYVLNKDGIAGLVTQNSWIYLDSYIDFRRGLLSNCSLKSIIELGSNAFYDLSGEKANVALLLFSKSNYESDNSIRLTSLKNLPQQKYEQLLSKKSNMTDYTRIASQHEIFNTASIQFDMFSSNRLKDILKNFPSYGEYAIPMQGTSTGDAKSLLDFYWMHTGDSDWVPVSKGGSYSRWQGLNYYCVKWGANGEFIKAQSGSAIRNAAYFNETQLVFSDTGTAGLNVRVLLPGQLFVASGPGIRLKYGNMYAHLAFLNSRFASYFIRLLSPKLTIAAGYIAKLPIIEKLLTSPSLAENGEKCLIEKRKRITKRPINIEFNLEYYQSEKVSISDCAFEWFQEDIASEWKQLCCEQAIEDEIVCAFDLYHEDIETIENQVGKKIVYSLVGENISVEEIENTLLSSLDANCMISRTRSAKAALGCDGIIEFISQKTGLSCEAIYKTLINTNIFKDGIERLYVNFFLHSIIIGTIGLGKNLISRQLRVNDLTIKILESNQNLVSERKMITKWIRNSFTKTHRIAFLNKPIYAYSEELDSIIRIGGDELE